MIDLYHGGIVKLGYEGLNLENDIIIEFKKLPPVDAFDNNEPEVETYFTIKDLSLDNRIKISKKRFFEIELKDMILKNCYELEFKDIFTKNDYTGSCETFIR